MIITGIILCTFAAIVVILAGRPRRVRQQRAHAEQPEPGRVEVGPAGREAQQRMHSGLQHERAVGVERGRVERVVAVGGAQAAHQPRVGRQDAGVGEEAIRSERASEDRLGARRVEA